MAREAELIEENERLRNAQAKHNTVAQGNRLARENERLRGEQAYRDSAGAVGGLVIGVLVFALAVLGIGAFFYLGRDLGSEQTQPTQSQPEATGEQDININVPQPPPITVEPPPQQRINVEVTPAPSATENRSATPPAIDTPAGATGASQAPVANPPVGDPVAPAAAPAPQQGVN
ncbi:MAG: hypothetical protein ICV62_00540 [Cyanobacteria bacterium Co-bin13]|nr:hypothetical protein [Cyanobacteria bacterium Co-bin13]